MRLSTVIISLLAAVSSAAPLYKRQNLPTSSTPAGNSFSNGLLNLAKALGSGDASATGLLQGLGVVLGVSSNGLNTLGTLFGGAGKDGTNTGSLGPLFTGGLGSLVAGMGGLGSLNTAGVVPPRER